MTLMQFCFVLILCDTCIGLCERTICSQQIETVSRFFHHDSVASIRVVDTPPKKKCLFYNFIFNCPCFCLLNSSLHSYVWLFPIFPITVENVYTLHKAQSHLLARGCGLRCRSLLPHLSECVSPWTFPGCQFLIRALDDARKRSQQKDTTAPTLGCVDSVS